MYELCKSLYSFTFSPLSILNIFIKLLDKETNIYFSSLENDMDVISPFLVFSFDENVKYKLKQVLLSLFLFTDINEILQFEKPSAIYFLFLDISKNQISDVLY